MPNAPIQDPMFSDLSHVQQSNTSNGLRIPLMTKDLLHRLISRPQTNDRAQVSMSVHNQHLGSEIFKRFVQNKKRSSTCFTRPRPIFVCCELVAVLSECRGNFNSTPNSLATAQMKSPSRAPLQSAYPSASPFATADVTRSAFQV